MRFHGIVLASLCGLALLPAPAPEVAQFLSGNGAYRLRVDAAGLGFTSANGSSLEFRRARIRVGGSLLEPSSVAPQRDPECWRFDEDGWSEQYWLRSEAIEQVFVLRRPVREDLTILMEVRSALQPVLDGKSVAFKDAAGKNQLVYRDAVVMDAAGHHQELKISVEENVLALHVPKEYLEHAVFPVVVDPLVGAFETLSPAGGLWRIPGVHLAWNCKERYYLSVWHQDIVFNSSTTQPPHNWLNGSIIRARAVRVKEDGSIEMGDPISSGKPYVGVTLGPVTTNDAAFGPRVRYNPVNNEFLVVWSEGRWSDGTIFGSAVTDMDNSGIVEYSYAQDPYPSNSRIVGVRVNVNPATLSVSTIPESSLEVSMGAGGTADNPSGPDTSAIHPSILPDVSWDGLQYVITWETLESPVIGAIENANPGYQYRHVFRGQARARYRLYSPAGAPLSTFVDLSNAKERFFIKGPTSDPANIVDGSVPANLKTELSYDSVPTDPHPHVDSLVLPGPDNRLGTADDIPLGSLMTWNVTSLVFNLGKSRVRGRYLPAGTNTPGIIWDVISPPDDIVQRAYVAAGPGDRPESSSFLVAYETVEDVVFKGRQKVEFVGSLQMRIVDHQGQPLGGAIEVARSDTGSNQFFLGPSVAWGGETQQYFVTWTQTDTRWNPVTLGVSYYPYGAGAFRDAPTQLFGTVATAYPVGAAASYAGVIDPLNVTTAEHHLMYVGQEDDFGANYLRRYKFVPPPGDRGGPPPSESAPASGGGGGGKSCGMGVAGTEPGPATLLAFAGALLLALFPGLGRTLRPRMKR